MTEEDKIMESAINECINYARCMIKQIDHAKRVNDNLSDVKTLAFAALVAYYGIEHIDEVYFAFLSTDFINCTESIDKIISTKYNVSLDTVMKASNHCPGTFYAVDAFKNLENNKFKFKRSIYVSSDVDNCILFRSVLHQANHVINSINNPVLRKHGSYVSRMGISLEHFESRRIEVLALEEAFNFLQIEEIMNEVERFGYYNIQDLGVKAICEALFVSSKSKVDAESDDFMVEIVRPLYEESYFNRRLVSGRLTGDLGRIRNCFDFAVGAGSFSTFLATCNDLEKLDGTSEEFKIHQDTAKTLVKTYIDKCNNN